MRLIEQDRKILNIINSSSNEYMNDEFNMGSIEASSESVSR